jgi:hypothetical protein
VGVEFIIDGAVRSVAESSFSFTHRFGEIPQGSYSIYSDEYLVVPGQHFRAYDNWGSSVFGGTNQEIRRQAIAGAGASKFIQHVTVVGWAYRLTVRRCGPKVYRSMTAKEIIQDLIATYATTDGIRTDGPMSDGASAVDLGIVTFIGETVWEAIQTLAEASGYPPPYVDADTYLHFGPITPGASLITYSAAASKYFNPSLTENRDEYYNRIWLAIAREAFEPLVIDVVADGAQQDFNFQDSGVDIAIDQIVKLELDGVEQTDIVQSADDEAGTWTYQYGDSKIYHNPLDPAVGVGQTVTLTVYTIGQNVVMVEDLTDINARQTIEDDDIIPASGVYEIQFEDLNIKDQNAGIARAGALLKKYCPHNNGGPAGVTHLTYEISTRSFQANAEFVRPGNTVTFETTNPSTSGAQTLVIESISCQLTGSFDPSDAPDPSGWFQYTVRLVNFTVLEGASAFFRRLMQGGGGGSSGATGAVSGGGGGGGATSLIHAMTLNSDVTVSSPVDPVPEGGMLTVILTQDGVGGRIITWDEDFKLAQNIQSGRMLPDTVSVFQFTGYSGKWWLNSLPVMEYPDA